MLFGRGYSLIGVASSFFAQNMIDTDQNHDRSRILIHDINFIEIKSSNNDTERVHHLAFYRKIFFKLLFRKYSKIFSKIFQEIIQKKDRSFLQKNNYIKGDRLFSLYT